MTGSSPAEPRGVLKLEAGGQEQEVVLGRSSQVLQVWDLEE